MKVFKIFGVIGVVLALSVIAVIVFEPIEESSQGSSKVVVSRPTAMPQSCALYYDHKMLNRGEIITPIRQDCSHEATVYTGEFRFYYADGSVKDFNPTTSGRIDKQIRYIESRQAGSVIEVVFCDPQKRVPGYIRCKP